MIKIETWNSEETKEKQRERIRKYENKAKEMIAGYGRRDGSDKAGKQVEHE